MGIVETFDQALKNTPAHDPLRSAYISAKRSQNYLTSRPAKLANDHPQVRALLESLRRSSPPQSLSQINCPAPESPDKELDWTSNWEVIDDAVRFAPNFWQPYLYQPEPHTQYYCYYEYRGPMWQWHIALTTADTVLGPYNEHEYPILSPSGDPGAPDAKGIADPTVLYLPDADPSWHMWFDMLGSDDIWRIGHATSTNGIEWSKQRNEQGETAVVLDIGESGDWDDDFVHAPEAFVYDGEVRLIYNAQGSGHSGYGGGLAVASDDNAFGYEFEKRGQTTAGETLTGGESVRIKPPFTVRGTTYALHSRDTNGVADICKTPDGGQTWEHVCEFPYHWANSFIREDGHLVGIGADRKLYVRRIE